MADAAQDIPFSCPCGSLKGVLHGANRASGTHVVCYCDDCRAAEIYCRQPDPAPEPVALFQTNPGNISFTEGKENLAVFSFGPRNLLRWQASCCGALIANTLRNPKLPMASIRTNLLATTDPIGPVRAEAFVPTPGKNTQHKGVIAIVSGTLRRMAVGRLSGTWKQTPFFDTEDATPVRPVTLVPKDVRAALTPGSRTRR